ncbi:uncharacterized protein B0H18DRAFT_1119812 [Fomitopsis serialis]|uniref:uncharacterized protein n=1 Tax=Fomitopsis serialis TaxID=139415 RepID=UPI002007D6A7|nr:uncharacterized protein B0H18DRAFT_1119812 [Neoantrodia serialis]KAH9924796.1 hypothetical protein B0H18DRAFT_1119812 [Neoantrodia serialis]
MYALLTLAITCLGLCAFQYAILSGTHAAHIEAPNHAELAFRMGELVGKRRNGSEVWGSQDASTTRFDNSSILEHLQLGEELSLETPSLTAVLPVTSASIAKLEERLHTLVDRSDYLTEIILVPEEALQAECRKIILSVLSAADPLIHVELSMTPWLTGMDKDSATLHASKQATTSFLLVSDEDGLENIDERGRDALTLLSPFSSAVPIGPRGATSAGTDSACLSASEIPQPADFLLPPFVAPARLFMYPGFYAERSSRHNIWRIFGKTVSDSRSDAVGGFMVGSDVAGSGWCPQEGALVASSNEEHSTIVQASTAQTSVSGTESRDSLAADEPLWNDVCPSGFGSLAILVRSADDLEHLSLAACRLQSNGHTLHIAVLGDPLILEPPGQTSPLFPQECSLAYHNLRGEDAMKSAAMLLAWLDGLSSPSDVIITSLPKNSILGATLSLSREADDRKPTIVHIPPSDLPYSDWVGSLSLDELRNWHKPEVAISVITNDRPQSLSRLLNSLSRARYFGDELDIRINIEQTADWETQQIVNDFTWDHGRMFLHRRIIHGGLLPAVVESWYPQSNDSYGLILEDDVELSPLFYGWIKLTLLRYRYGRPEDASPQLFGISLYQQKHLELRPEGRHPFNARNTFASKGRNDPSTPYLSQIPCSWGQSTSRNIGASSMPTSPSGCLIPGVRSNKWTRSWKKYFIELAYLRGYLMLYPNYADYVSLSTNHLEVGSHVKDVPIETYLRKKRLFLLPLMPLPEPTRHSSTGLLDLPQGQLPLWTDLPTLDLLGLVASEETLQERGRVRRTELTGCEDLRMGNTTSGIFYASVIRFSVYNDSIFP